MKILLANTAGFCMGVRRAVQMALETSRSHNDRNIYTMGPLIHNPQTIEMLRKRNVRQLVDIDEAGSGILIIRAHGITPEQKMKIQQSGLEFADATCPLVKRIQSLISLHTKKGYNIAIIGDRGHSEVAGLMGYAGDRGTVVENETDIDAIPPGKLCVVAQSTQNNEIFDALVEKIKQRFAEVEVFNTICRATIERQDEVRQLAQKVNALVIVGGKTSANTKRLAEISESRGVPTFLVENERDLDVEQLKNFKTVGITAGASTPNWVIERVVDVIRQLSHRISGFQGRIMQFLDFLVKSDIFLGLGAMLLYYATTTLMGLNHRFVPALTVGITIFSLHMLNHYTDPDYTAFKESYKSDFFQQKKLLLLPLGFLSLVVALILSAVDGTASFLCIFIVVLLGILYSVAIVPKKLQKRLKIVRLRDIPATKDVGVAMVWGTLTAIYPLLDEMHSFKPAALVAFLFTFTLLFVRSSLLEIRDIRGDIMFGSETVPVMIGKDKTKILLAVLIGITSAVLIAAALLQWTSLVGIFFLIPVGYAFLYLYLYHRRVVTQGISWELIAGSNFLLTFLVALIWNAVTM